MHKIKKGFKKKKKDKKDKDAELFTPEEYEKYKKQKEEEQKLKEQEQHQQQQEEDGTTEEQAEEVVPETHHESVVEEPHQTEENNCENGEKKEDWRNFLSATDTVLKKTSDNLEHIKESSYFQAVKKHEEVVEEKVGSSASSVPPPVPAPPTKRWVDLNKGIDDNLEDGEGEEEEENHLEEQEEKPKPVKPLKDIVLKPIEDIPIVAEEDYADVFDTTYVDAVEGGEVQLYQIPDSPTLEDLNEPDPFDTSNAEKVLHIEKKEPKQVKVVALEKPQKKKKRNLVNLGCAVDVLTGKAVETVALKKKSKEVDLLLADFGDESETQLKQKEDEEEDKGKDKDKEEVAEDKEILEKKEEEKCALDDLLFGGETDADLFIVSNCLLLESDSKGNQVEGDPQVEKNLSNIQEDLAELLDSLVSTEGVSTDSKESHLKDLVAEFDVIDKGKIAPAVPVIPELLKTTSLGIDDNIQDEFDAEFAVLAAESIAKEKEKAIDEISVIDEDDPFDTSSVNKVLGESDSTNNQNIENVEEEVDPFNVDFAKKFIKESKPSKPPRPVLPKLNSLSAFADEDPFDTSAADKFLPSDPFEAVEDSLSLPETLKPQLGSEIPPSGDVDPQESEEFDPFDTSAADAFGLTELKVLEGELLSDISQKVEETDDFDFNPREEEKLPVNAPPVRPPSPACLLTTTEETSGVPVLTPQTADIESEEFDPFDTSIAEKVHIKSLEDELLSDIQSNTSLSVADKSIKTVPPRPVSPSCLISSFESEVTSQISFIAKRALAEDFDPFDTSIADQFHSLDNKQEKEPSSENLKLNLKPPRPASPVCLLATTPTDANPTLVPILQPTTKSITTKEENEEEFDPFDTSIAEQFGKTELKVLETELLSIVHKVIEEDDSFNPRTEDPKPSRPPPPRPLSPACLLSSTGDEVEQNLPPLSPFTAEEFHRAVEEIDPFDTSIADKFGKTEIFHLESEFLSDIKEVTPLNPVNISSGPPQRPPLPNSQCVFATTPTDSNPSLQPFSQNIPQPKEGITAEEVDPFDTSIADQFGKTELKALEETFLSERQEIKPNTETVSNTLKIEQKDHLFDISPSADCLPVLQPSSNSTTQPGNTILAPDNYDPFDTSIAAKFGQVELKVLESELLVDSGVKRNLSDDEFDPREEEKSIKRISSSNETSSINILDCEVVCSINAVPILQANQISDPLTESEVDIDPFDTSIAEHIVPCKQELKLLDQELLGTD